MNCSNWRRLGCFVLVQVAAISGCQRVQDAPGSAPVIHLIIPEDYRGPIEFNDETGDPLPEPVNGERRIEIDEHGRSDIDAVQGIAEQPLRVSLSSGETVKHCDLRRDEVGFRSTAIFYTGLEDFDFIYFVGTASDFENYLSETYGNWYQRESQHRHLVTSGHLDEYLLNEITEQGLAETPLWDGKNGPPLSEAQAVKIATDAARTEKIDAFYNDVPTLKTTALMGLGRRHYWRIRFEYWPASGGASGMMPTLEVIVLMNGRILPPRFIKDPNY